MPTIHAKVTATDPKGQLQLTIDKDPIEVPPNRQPHDIVFRLDDRTSNGPVVFDSGDPIYYANGQACPSGGKNSDQLDVESCSDRELKLNDVNSQQARIGYQLNFRYAGKREQLDPMIING